ncbi:MAG: COG4705 family protein [Halothiobacillus sp.]
MPTFHTSTVQSPAAQFWSKVPEVTLFFWIIKIMATTVGETAADYLNRDLNFGLTVTSLVMAGLLAVVLVIQVRAERYTPWLYWLAVVLISVVGTLITDNMVDHFGISLQAAAIGFAIALSATFAAWFLSEKTLSIHSIYTRRRELFYWLAILFTFALGTAGGDLTAEGLHLGYWLSALMFAGIIAAMTAAYYFLNLNAVLAFWIAYILTRPLGASFGDYLSQPVANGGLGLGTTGTSVIFLGVILALVVYLTLTRRDVIAVK